MKINMKKLLDFIWQSGKFIHNDDEIHQKEICRYLQQACWDASSTTENGVVVYLTKSGYDKIATSKSQP